jgi:tripartite-type tricarboxylate transporter receptor subunit TctC
MHLSKLAAILPCALPLLSSAQTDSLREYPNRPIRFIVPYLPGAGTDLTTRAIAKKLAENWGQQVVVDNRAGATGIIGIDMAANANPDGYTLCTVSSSISILPATKDKLPFEFGKDLTGISQYTSLHYILTVHPSVPAKSVQELVAYAKANPDKLKQGSSGTAGLQHLAGALLTQMTGAKFIHVPYKGGAGAVAATVSNEVDMAFATFLSSHALVKSGRLRYLAVTSLKRSPVIPDLPTIAESGVPGYEINQWYGAVAPAATPPALIEKIANGIRQAVLSPEVSKRLAGEGSNPTPSTPQEFNKLVTTEMQNWKRLVKESGLKLK